MQRSLMITFLLLLMIAPAAKARTAPATLMADAVLVLREMAEQPDSQHLQSMLKKGHGVVIFPQVIKVGLGLGGRYGEGLILQFDAQDRIWYGPYFVNLKGLSYGFQIGLQSTALILVVTSERGMESLKEETITLGGNLSIAAGPLGRSAEAGTDLKLTAPIYSYSISKGAFVGATLEGAVISSSGNANRLYWGETLQATQALARKAGGESIAGLLRELNNIVAQVAGGD